MLIPEITLYVRFIHNGTLKTTSVPLHWTDRRRFSKLNDLGPLFFESFSSLSYCSKVLHRQGDLAYAADLQEGKKKNLQILLVG